MQRRLYVGTGASSGLLLPSLGLFQTIVIAVHNFNVNIYIKNSFII